MKIKMVLRTLPTLDRFPQITAVAVPGWADGTEVDAIPRRPAQAIQKAAKRASSACILVFQQGESPSWEWIGAAQDLFHRSPSLACVTAGGAEDGPAPTLGLDPAAMVIRRDVLLESGGLSQVYQGVGDGLDLGWRLWLMGYQVLRLPTRVPISRQLASPSLYLVYRNWLWTLVRNCEEASLGLALSKALLQMMAWASKLVARTDIVHLPNAPQPGERAYIEETIRLRDHTTNKGSPIHRVTLKAGETLTVFHDMIPLLPVAFKERKSVQKLRRCSDKEIEAALGQAPVRAVQDYFTDLSRESLKLHIEDQA